MATCKKCGNNLGAGDKFCMYCGTPVSVGNNAAAKATAVCSKCGNTLQPNDKFCMQCGTRVEMQQQPARPAEKGWFTDGVRAVANAITGMK